MDELPCICINLDERKDKWAKLQSTFQGTQITPIRFSAIKHTEGWRGCGASHIAIVKDAYHKKLSWILVIEDDCELADDFNERWPSLKKELWDTRDTWDIFLGGPTFVQGPVEPQGKQLVKIEKGFALHFYILNAVAYRKIMDWDPDKNGQVDVYYSKQLRIITTLPLIAKQRASVSDIEQEAKDYLHLFIDSEKLIKKLLYANRTRGTTLTLVFTSMIVLFGIWYNSKRGLRV